MNDKYPHIGVWLDAEILADTELTPAEKLILAYVLGWWRQGKECFAGSQTIAEALALNVTWVRETRNRLVDKGHLAKYAIGDKLVFKPADKYLPTVSGKPTGVSGKPTGGVGKTDGGCRENRHYNSIYNKIYNKKEREEGPLTHLPDSKTETPQQPTAGSKDWYHAEALRYLDAADGSKPWERDNQYVTAGRRPMVKYGALWFTPLELADALETVTNALPTGCDIRPVFKLAQSEALSQSVQHNRKVSAYKYVTTFCLQQHQETLRKGKQLLNTIQGGKR